MEKYKRYMIFEYIQYYPSGGLCDVVRDFDTLNEILDYSDYDETSMEIFDRIEGVTINYCDIKEEEKVKKEKMYAITDYEDDPIGWMMNNGGGN